MGLLQMMAVRRLAGICHLLVVWLAASAATAAETPSAVPWLFSDEPLLPGLKQQELGDEWTWTAGAELRTRYMDERNRLRPLGETERDTYWLTRATPFLELKRQDVTLYLQGIDAESFGEELPPLIIDVNRADLLQYYADVNLYDFETGELHVKAGRQFLQYGSQHLVSPLGWANTFRPFEAVKLYYSGEVWNVDAFVASPVNGAGSARQFHPYSRDELDSSLTFSGVYATFKALPRSTLDLYWLWFDERDDLETRLDGSRHTLGARIAGQQPLFDDGPLSDDITLSWDLEAAWQFGQDRVAPRQDLDVSAGFVSTNTGLTFTSLPWTPAVAGIWFWGSGDEDPLDDRDGTFNTLFPLGHAYWGQMDNFNGSNLRDAAVQFSLKPTQRLNLVTQYHFLAKDSAADFIWNIAGVPFGNRTTPETDLGQELDLVATLQFNKNLQLQAGYFWFWYGDAVSMNAGIPARGDAEQFYLMTTWRF
jgi:hypothetical protein